MDDYDELPGPPGEGHIDLYMFSREAGGLLLCGWVSGEVARRIRIGVFLARFPGADRSGISIGSFYVREGLGERGIGVVLFIACARPPEGPLLWLRLGEDDDADIITPTPQTRQAAPREGASLLVPLMDRATPALPDSIVRAVRESRRVAPRAGEASRGAVLWHVDEVIVSPPRGVVLIGWCLAQAGAIRSLRLRSGGVSMPIDMARAVRVSRPGVLEAVGHANGFDEKYCGFVVHVPAEYSPAGPNLVDVETVEGTGAHPLPLPRFQGMAAIRHLLSECDAQSTDLAEAFDSLLGPAVACPGAAHAGG